MFLLLQKTLQFISQAARHGQAVLRATADVVRKTEKMANFHAAPRNQFLIDRA